MWSNLSLDQCLLFRENANIRSEDLLSLKNIDVLAREMLRNRSLDTAPLRELLIKWLDEYKIRHSAIKYGLTTASIPELTAHPKWIEDIPQGQLIDFIMASARYPGLKPVTIDGQRFIDGGVAENLPLTMLRQQGCRRIIAVNLSSKPLKRTLLTDNTLFIHIRNPLDLGRTFDLTPESLHKNQRLGYDDLMKAFGRFEGCYFTFPCSEYNILCKTFGPDHLTGLEQAALAYGLDRTVLYTAERFLLELSTKARQNGNNIQIPLGLFHNMDHAADALCRLDEIMDHKMQPGPSAGQHPS